MSLIEHAKKELEIAGLFNKDSAYDGALAPAVMELVEVFSKQGHSGMSASLVLDLFKKVASYDCIDPVKGTDDEWVDVDDHHYQNNRVPGLFKRKSDGKAYYLDAIVWRGQEPGDTFTGKVGDYRSRNFVKSFPFVPRTYYIDVIKDFDYQKYPQSEVVEGHNEKYVYCIKHIDKLEAVFEYYDRFENEK